MAMPCRPLVPLASSVPELPCVLKEKMAYEFGQCLEFRRVLFGSPVLVTAVLISSSVLLLVAFSVPVLASVSLLRSRSPPLASSRPTLLRSEERRVGKEGRSRWSPYH